MNSPRRMLRISRPRSEALLGANRSPPKPGDGGQRSDIHPARRPDFGRGARLLQTAARAVFAGHRGSLPSNSPGRRSPSARPRRQGVWWRGRTTVPLLRLSSSTALAASPIEDANTSRSPGRPMTPAPGSTSSATPASASRFRPRAAAHVVAEQSAEPHHPVVERSRSRSAGRGDLSARRG